MTVCGSSAGWGSRTLKLGQLSASAGRERERDCYNIRTSHGFTSFKKANDLLASVNRGLTDDMTSTRLFEQV